MRTARRRRSVRRGRGRRHRYDLLLLVLFLGSFAICLVPVIELARTDAQARQAVSSMSCAVDATFDESRMDALSQAQRYNEALCGAAYNSESHLGGGNGGNDDVLQVASRTEGEPLLPYDEQLRWRDGAGMCWLEIPRLELKEVVYHSASDEALSMGVGHVEWSSLPIGGLPSHCVLAAHSGMQQALMFDQLDLLEEGDTFTVHTLGDAYQYRVFAVETVLPDQAQDRCAIVPGDDLCTLMTCTPYGINTHRLLVHGRRCAFDASPAPQRMTLERAAHNRHIYPLALLCVSSCMPLGARIASAVLRRIRSRRVSHKTWRDY